MEQNVKDMPEQEFEKEIDWEVRQEEKQEERLRKRCAGFFRDVCKEFAEKGEASRLYGFLKAEYDREARRTVQEYEALRGRGEAGAGEMLVSFRSGKKNKAFYVELYLNYYAYRKGYITAAEYYVWLVEYLDATTERAQAVAAETESAKKKKKTKLHSMYYLDERLNCVYAKTNSRYAYEELYPLLSVGYDMNTDKVKNRASGIDESTGKKKTKKSILKHEIEKMLEELNEKLHGNEGAKVRKRLDDLPETYLINLTRMLKKMAMYWKIAEFFEGNGHPLYLGRAVSENGEEERIWNIKVRLPEKVRSHVPEAVVKTGTEPKKKRGRPSLTEKSVEKNYREPGRDLCLVLDQIKGNGGGTKDGYVYHMGMDADVAKRRVELLMGRLNQYLANADSENSYVFVPLVTDVVSGCVLAIVGKQNYAALYEHGKSRYEKKQMGSDKENYLSFRKDYNAYVKDEKKCCIDILYLNMQDCMENPQNPRGSYRLLPRFHRNVRKEYKELLEEFQKYCVVDEYYKGAKEKLPVWLEEKDKPDYLDFRLKENLGMPPKTPREVFWYCNPLADDMGVRVFEKLPKGMQTILGYNLNS